MSKAKEDCKTCTYRETAGTSSVCSYILMECQRRPCQIGECKQAGIWKPKPKRKRKWRPMRP